MVITKIGNIENNKTIVCYCILNGTLYIDKSKIETTKTYVWQFSVFF